MAGSLPPLPPGFTLDQAGSDLPPLPEGFTLDGGVPASTPTSGGPVGRRRANTPAQRGEKDMRDWNKQPWYVRATMAPDELQPGGMEARTKATADAGAVVASVPEQALAGATGTVGTFADILKGDVNNRSQSWAYQPRTGAGQRGAQLTGEFMAPGVEAVSRGYDRTFGTGPAAQTLKERFGQAAEAVGATTGAGMGVRAVLRPRPPLPSPEEVVARSRPSTQSMGAAAAAQNLQAVSPELRQAVSTIGKDRPVNLKALERKVDAETLPVPIRLTEGEALGDVTKISNERNSRGRLDEAARFYDERNRALGENMQAIRDRVGPQVFSANVVEHGDSIIGAYRQLDEQLSADIRAKYKALADANGGDLPVDGKSFVAQAAANLKKAQKAPFLPAEIKKLLVQYRTRPMTMENFENLRTTLATAARSSNDGNVRAAISQVRNALENLQMVPTENIVMTGRGFVSTRADPARIKELADAAREASRARFERLENDPAFKAAVEETIPPDRFVQRFVVGGTRDNLARMSEAIPEARETMAVAALDYLRDAARVGPGQAGNFATESYMRALRKVDPGLRHFLSPEDIDQLEQLGRVAGIVMRQPHGSFVNNSNTFVAAAGNAAGRVLEGTLNIGGTGVGTMARDALKTRAAKSEWQRIIAPEAGL